MSEKDFDSSINEYIEIKNSKSILELEWEMAIGLQQVDDLTSSSYMKDLIDANIKKEISFDELESKLKEYYKKSNNNYNQDEYECDYVSLRIIQILQNNMFFLTIDFYKYIHKYLFQDVYDFVGRFREVNISKNEDVLNGDTVVYCDYGRIRDYLIYDFSEERQEDYSKLSESDKIVSIANFTSCIWQVHPFMEGNTRTTAIFMIKYLKELGYNINYSLFKDNSKYFRNALVRSNYSNNKLNIKEDNSYLIKFYENLLLGKNNNLKLEDLSVLGGKK